MQAVEREVFVMQAKVALTVTNGELTGRKYVLYGPQTFSVGRAAGCDIAIPEDYAFKTVSRHHCLIDVDSNHIVVRDTGSRNGTRLNGMQIGRPALWYLGKELSALPARAYDLHDGDELDVGGVVFHVTMSQPADQHPEWCEEGSVDSDMRSGALTCGG